MTGRGVAAALLLTAAGVLVSAPAAAGVLLLEDGRAIRYVGDLTRGKGVVVFTLEGGALVSLREADIDWPATARAARLLGEPTTVPPGPGEDEGGAPVRVASEPPVEVEDDAANGAPRDLESLPEEAVIGALVHTGRREIGPAEAEGEVSARLVTTPGSDAGASEGVVELPAGGEAGRSPTRAPPAPITPYHGDASGVAARRRLAPLVEPAPAPVEVASLARPEPPERGQRARFVEPVDGSAVYASTRLEAVPSAGGAEVESIEYRVDGRFVGVARPPESHVVWRVPAARGRHEVSALIRRRDGSSEVVRARVRSILPDAAVEVDLVSLSVTVTNQRYFFVRELERDDFLVYEDGVRQEISHFSRESVPLTLMVLIDSSWSMNGAKLEMAVAGVGRLLDRLGPADRVGVATFAEGLQLLQPVTRDRAAVRSALAGLTADGGTAMFDAELRALEELAWEGGRRVLIVLGDGEDYTSTAGVDEVVRAAHASDVSVYSVGILTYRVEDGMPEHWAEGLGGRARPKYWSDRARVRGLKFLKRQSESTGGVLYLPKFTGELPYVFEHIVAELKSAYSIGYYPSNQARDGRFRKVALYVDGAGLVVRTRQGYYAAEASATRLAGAPAARPVNRAPPTPR